MPIDYKKYPSNWKALRLQVLERAKNCCEFCGLENYSIGYRDGDIFNEIEKSFAGDVIAEDAKYMGFKVIKIVLTIAHLDHDETNHEIKIERLAALCQRCHLRYDVKEKVRRRKFIKNQTELL